MAELPRRRENRLGMLAAAACVQARVRPVEEDAVRIKVVDEWEIRTAGRKGWMDRVEWAGKQAIS